MTLSSLTIHFHHTDLPDNASRLKNLQPGISRKCFKLFKTISGRLYHATDNAEYKKDTEFELGLLVFLLHTDKRLPWHKKTDDWSVISW